jgi:archaellum component FlaC
MKNVFLFSILFWPIALPALGELTDADLNKIRLIVQEEIKKESSTTNQKIDALDARIQNVEKDVAWVRGKLDGIDKQFEGIREQITHVTYATYGVIGIIILVVGIPQITLTLRSGRDRSLERQIEVLTREVETLKQQRIVNP